MKSTSLPPSPRAARRQVGRALIFLGVLFLCSPAIAVDSNDDASTRYDVVLIGGRVIDPETGLDGLRNVGLMKGTIKAIST